MPLTPEEKLLAKQAKRYDDVGWGNPKKPDEL